MAADAGAEPVVCDVTDSGDRARLTALDVVTDDDWDAIASVNARALFFLTRAFAARLQPGGAMVNVASVAGKTGSTHEAAVYGASKAAVDLVGERC